MFNAYTDALNSILSFNSALGEQQENLLNFNTFGYRGKRTKLLPSNFGVVLAKSQRNLDPARSVFVKGEKVTKLTIDKDFSGVYFLAKDNETDYLTRLGDFKYHRQQRHKDTYIGQPLEERTYLATQDGYLIMGNAIGRGPVTQEERFKDPMIDPNYTLFGESPITTPEKRIGSNEPLKKGPLIPIDLTRGANGLILDRYEDLRTSKNGVIEGLRKGLWVPLYQLALYSVPNPDGLAFIGNTPYRTETEQSGLKQAAPPNVRIRSEQVEKSNINLRYDSYHYRNLRNSLNLALQLQRSNNQLLQQFQQLLTG
ncbi:MAG: hypothetical protein QNJ31_00490 [Candidatus Caenarcaniphilales bacterium]|nr:hypothetical protein [Candidatus Caenarcaniphilales bacterium]